MWKEGERKEGDRRDQIQSGDVSLEEIGCGKNGDVTGDVPQEETEICLGRGCDFQEDVTYGGRTQGMGGRTRAWCAISGTAPPP
eukprot:3837787-Rhodomonas_salina.1